MADLRNLVEAFKELAATLNNSTQQENVELGVAPFAHACSLISPLFVCVGIAYKFAEMDYVAKVHDLAEVSQQIGTLNAILDGDVKANRVRIAGSHTRNLLRVKRGVDMLKVLFEQILATDRGNSLRDPASNAYDQVFAPYHGWMIRKAVAAGMHALPTKAEYFQMLNEDERLAKAQMQNYITASAPVITYVENLFISRGLGTDW
ncbi:accelerated cell death 11-like [Rutidosis leptorrhynchoides]|uniref:accelerated cell death 11-like n=1 Tax=Rutidosis leptorrhynchoides TaxID=125765 RepID=UPI003A99D4FB